MEKFIRVQVGSSPLVVNTRYVITVFPNNKGNAVLEVANQKGDEAYFHTDHPFEEVVGKLGL